jgi:hypothetical protein
MIKSREKNQKVVNRIIEEYHVEFYQFAKDRPAELRRFIKYFAKHIMTRMDEEDCFFVDMMEDIERLGDE